MRPLLPEAEVFDVLMEGGTGGPESVFAEGVQSANM